MLSFVPANALPAKRNIQKFLLSSKSKKNLPRGEEGHPRTKSIIVPEQRLTDFINLSKSFSVLQNFLVYRGGNTVLLSNPIHFY